MDNKTPENNADDFYAGVFSEAERVRLEAARELEGIDEEVALLRMMLRDQMARNPDSARLFFKGMNMLTKAVTTQYKLSPKSRDDLNDSIIGVLNGIGRELWPEGMP